MAYYVCLFVVYIKNNISSTHNSRSVLLFLQVASSISLGFLLLVHGIFTIVHLSLSLLVDLRQRLNKLYAEILDSFGFKLCHLLRTLTLHQLNLALHNIV